MHKESKTFYHGPNAPTADDILTLVWEYNLSEWTVEVVKRAVPTIGLAFTSPWAYDIIFERTIT